MSKECNRCMSAAMNRLKAEIQRLREFERLDSEGEMLIVMLESFIKFMNDPFRGEDSFDLHGLFRTEIKLPMTPAPTVILMEPGKPVPTKTP